MDYKLEYHRCKGIMPKYLISRSDGSPTDIGAEYFVLRLDAGGSDPRHVAACRKAVIEYARHIADHLPLLSKELLEKYSPLAEYGEPPF